MSSAALLPSDKAAPLVLADHAQHVGHGIVSRTVLATPELRVVLFSFAAGQSLTEHTSTSRALLHVLTGEGELQFGDESADPSQETVADRAETDRAVPHRRRDG